MIRILLAVAVLAGAVSCGPQPKLDDGLNPYAAGPPPAPKPAATKP